MKKLLTLLCTIALLLSLCGTALAEETEPTSGNLLEKPVHIAVFDELGAPVTGAELRLSGADNQMVDTWISDENDHRIFLKEGEYSIENLSLPEGYMEDSDAVHISVGLTEEELGTYKGFVQYNRSYNILCTAPDHAGIELYTVDGNIAYCFNHGKNNPAEVGTEGTDYTMHFANPELLFANAQNKNDTDTPQDLYDHVLGIIYNSSAVQTKYNQLIASGFYGPETNPVVIDDVLIRFLAQYAIKNFTDPKLFFAYDKDGNKTIICDENGKPIRVNGQYQYNGKGCVLGTVIHHVTEEHKGEEGYVFPQVLKDAYLELISFTDYPSDYYLYIYEPQNTNRDGEQFQWLMSAKQGEVMKVTVPVRAATQFEVTLKWSDGKSKTRQLPSTDAVADAIRLYADDQEVTALYRDRLMVVDNHDGTYSVCLNPLRKLNQNGEEITYSMRMSSAGNYMPNRKVVYDGQTLTFSYASGRDFPSISPIKPIKPIGPLPFPGILF